MQMTSVCTSQTRSPPFCPLPPPAIMTMSSVIKEGKREVGRDAVGGETTGQAFDEFSEINMLGGDLAVELKCQRMLSCCSCRKKLNGR